MSFCNSRRWLVINGERLKKHATASLPTATTSTTKAKSLCLNRYFYSTKNCHALTTQLSKTVKTSQKNPSTGIKTSKISRTFIFAKGAPFRVKPCPNQIIVFILNVLLANCLISGVAKTPTVGAAFGAELIEDNDRIDLFGINPLSVNYRNRQGNLFHHDDYQQNFNLYNNNNNNHFGDQKSANQLPRSQNFKISPKPCSIGRIEGTCMFVWECIKSEGRHVGMCVDSFMFGSCCSHNASDNIVLSDTFSYTRPTKPVGMSSVNHRPRPPHYPQKPSISGMTTIERPHGAGTLVIRPSGPHHQGVLFKPQSSKTKPTQAATTKNPNSVVSFDMQSAASIPATNMWLTSPQTTHQQHWQLPTEPNFITKPRPPSWEKPSSMRPKPSKPSKKPIVHHDQTNQHPQTPPLAVATHSTGKPTATTTKPKPQVFSTKPMKTTTIKTTTTTSTTRPYFRPTAGWENSESPLSTIFSTTSGNYTSSAFSSSSPSTTQLNTRPPASPVTHHQQQHNLITTRPPTLPAQVSTSITASSSLSSSSPSQSPLSSSTFHSSTPTATSAASIQQQHNHHHHHQQQQHHQQHHQQTPSTLNLSTVESNEIVDSSSSDPKLTTIKTITAARSECGIPVLQRPETRIVGGKPAPFGRWPWQVSVRRTSFFGFSSTHRCGGALINENWIATAGHCVDDLLISQIRIRVGEYDFSHVQEQLPYIERGVSKKVVHPKYNFFTYEYDLALVKLEQPLEFAPHVSPICLPQTDSLLIGMNATVTGWGRLSEGGTLPSVLQEVSVPIVSNDNCKSMFLRAGRQEFIPDIFLCAGYETGGQDSCQGDSGGPLQVKSQDGRFFLAGIISWGIGCAEANLPGVCTRISKFVPWIMENVT